MRRRSTSTTGSTSTVGSTREEAAGERTTRFGIHSPATSNAAADHQQRHHRCLELKVAAPCAPDLERE
jgi:hypothetical protein